MYTDQCEKQNACKHQYKCVSLVYVVPKSSFTYDYLCIDEINGISFGWLDGYLFEFSDIEYKKHL